MFPQVPKTQQNLKLTHCVSHALSPLWAVAVLLTQGAPPEFGSHSHLSRSTHPCASWLLLILTHGICLVSPLHSCHDFRNPHLPYTIKLAFLLFFPHQVLLHLQPAFHTIFTVNFFKGLSGLKSANCFPCLEDKVRSLNEAPGICPESFWCHPIQGSSRTEPTAPQTERITLCIGPHCLPYKLAMERISLLLHDNSSLLFLRAMDPQYLGHSLLARRPCVPSYWMTQE